MKALPQGIRNYDFFVLYNLYNVYMKTLELIENTALKTLNYLLGGSVTVDSRLQWCFSPKEFNYSQ